MSGAALGSGDRPMTMSQLRAQDAAAAAAAAGGDDARDWSNGGRIRHTLTGVPIATLTLMLLNFALYFYELSDDSIVGNEAICIAPVVQQGEWARVITNAYFHMSVLHILMNMAAFYSIGSSVERSMGTLCVFGQTALFTVLIGFAYLGVENIAFRIMNDLSYVYQCAVGFSGVIFAFLVVDTGLAIQRGETTRRLFGSCAIPVWMYPILMLALMSLLMPSISFAGHVSGCIVGLLYARGMFLPLSLPRSWLLAIDAKLPSRLTNARGYCHTPAQSPFESWEPACFRGECPAPPMVGPDGCLPVARMLSAIAGAFNGDNRRRVGGGGQASGRAAGAPARGVPANSSLLQAAHPPAGGGGLAPDTRSRSSSASANIDPPSRSFPAVPPGLATLALQDAHQHQTSAVLSAPPASGLDLESGGGQGVAMDEGGGGGAGGYARLMPNDDDDHFGAPAQEPLHDAHASQADLEAAVRRSLQER